MTMGDTARRESWVGLMDRLSVEHQEISIPKADLRAAVDAIDLWLSDNEASANNALPVAARTGLSKSQKALLMQYVISQRYLEGV